MGCTVMSVLPTESHGELGSDTHFKWPPDIGAAEKMNKLSPIVFTRAAYSADAKGDLLAITSPELAAPSTNVSKQVPICC